MKSRNLLIAFNEVWNSDEIWVSEDLIELSGVLKVSKLWDYGIKETSHSGGS